MIVRLVLIAFAALSAVESAAAPIEIDARVLHDFPVAALADADSELRFLGGLELSAAASDFGGLSGVDMLDDGTAFFVGDRGTFVRLRLLSEHGQLAGVTEAEMGELFPGAERSKAAGDTEDVAFDPRDPRRGVIVRERQANAMLAFEMREGKPSSFEPRRVGAPDRMLRSNRGLESVAYAPPGSPLAGDIVTIAERPPSGGGDIPAWIAGVGQFSIVRRDGFDISSARFLPNGDLLLLERRQFIGWGMRLRRIDGSAIEVGGVVDGRILLEAGWLSGIDNMEGLAVHLDQAGRTILTLVSDDNHSVLQRTLILQFALAED